jgi:hypothetical protein
MKEEHFVVTSRDAIRYGFFDRNSAVDCAKKFRAELGIAASVIGPGYEISAAEIRQMIDEPETETDEERTKRLP